MKQLKLFLCFLLAAAGFAQTITGTLEGRITDATGAAIAGASISVVNGETGLKRQTNSNAEGFFQLTFLPIGPYTVAVEAKGFARQSRETPVELNATRVLDFSLQLASVATEVTITEDAPLLEVSRGDLKSTIETQVIEDRPLSSRNILSLVEMLPGFQSSGGFSGVNNPTLSSGSYVSFNGAGTRSAAFQIDGVGNDDSSEGSNRQNVNISAIREFQVLTNAYSAEFGRAGGAVVLVQTKSGGNKFHGDAYEYLQNEKLNANAFYSNSFGSLPNGQPVQPRAPYRRNQYGYTVGGPIIKNKLFFFHSFEQTKHIQYTNYTRFVWPEGIKVEVGECRLCLRPSEHPNLEADRKWLQDVIERWPKEVAKNPAACPNCVSAQRRNYWPDGDISGKLDWQPNQRDMFTARYQYSRQRRQSAEFVRGEAAWQNNKQQNMALTWTHMFGVSTWGEFRYGLGLRTTRVDISDGRNVPIVRISNPSAFPTMTTLGSAGQFPINRFQTDNQFVYNLSLIRGRHSVRVGVDWRRLALDDLADNSSRGSWSFIATGTLGTPERYEGWENFLRGFVSGGFSKGYGNFFVENRLGEMNQYILDDWKIKPNLTLNLGLRSEVVFAPTEVQDRIVYGFGTFSGLQPRVGLAWSPRPERGFWQKITGGSGKSAVRAGFGLFNNRIFQSVFSQGSASLRSLPPNGLFRSFNAGFDVADPTQGFVFTPGQAPAAQFETVRVDPGLKMPAIQQYHLTLERQFKGQLLVSIGYNRTRGIGLLQNQVTNRARFPFTNPVTGVAYDKIDPNLTNTNPAPGFISIAQQRVNQRRPDQRYTNVWVISNNAWSYYNALRLEVKKRYNKGYHWQIAYTFGRTIDTGSDVSAGVTITEEDGPITNRGLSDLHRKHSLNLNGAYDLPFFKQSKGLVQVLLGGWKITANSTMASGNPFTVTAGVDLNADGWSNDRPILLDQSLFGRSVDNGRIDPTTGLPYSAAQLPMEAFAPNARTPAAQRPWDPGGKGKGSLGRNTFFGQGIFNLDMGIQKAFRITETHRLNFRAEAFGATNTPRFGFPTASTNSASFGRISSTYSPFNYVGAFRSDSSSRLVMLSLRYVF
jgi:hypothetical protein